MKAFIVKQGTKVQAVIFNSYGSAPTIEKKEMKKDVMYFSEDICIDPLGKLGAGPQSNTIGGSWAKMGFYGFELPENSKGYKIMLVHANDVEIK